VEVDEAGGDDLALGVDDSLGDAGGPAADLCDLAVLDPDVGLVSRHSCPVHHRSTGDVDVRVAHAGPFPNPLPKTYSVRTPDTELGGARMVR
jgi:hypothetical protein